MDWRGSLLSHVTQATLVRVYFKIKLDIQACLHKRYKYVSGSDGEERFDSNRCDVDSDPAGLATGIREPRRGYIYLLVKRAHRLRLPGARPRQQTRRIQQTGLPGTFTQSGLSRNKVSLEIHPLL